MIGFLYGKVLFSDGVEIVILTNSGVGYQAYFSGVAIEGSSIGVFTSHVIKETSQEIFSFKNLRDKKAFELLLTVNGVGPKSAYSLVKTLGCENLIEAVTLDNKALLKEAPGVGLKSASQIILDLKDKIKKLKMYTNGTPTKMNMDSMAVDFDMESIKGEAVVQIASNGQEHLMKEALMACNELGFKESQILPIARKILSETSVQKSEQLVHLVLKQIG
ncbi:MAG: Holliday junction branch migration protein RuvA [Bacteriovoracaceae bacterium]